MGDAECTDGGLLAEICDAFFQVGIDCERKPGFGNVGHLGGLEGFGGGLGGFGKFARIFGEMFTRRDVTAAQFVEAPGTDNVAHPPHHVYRHKFHTRNSASYAKPAT
jgi:hypothetical protein